MERFNKEQDETKRNNIETNPLKIFLTALDNCKPLLKLEPVNRGGITYQCPMPMSERESEFRSIKFILTSANDKDRNVRFYDSLSNELLDAYQFQVKNNSNFYSNMQKKIYFNFNLKGKSIKKKVDLHKLAEANRAYAHYRWLKN